MLSVLLTAWVDRRLEDGMHQVTRVLHRTQRAAAAYLSMRPVQQIAHLSGIAIREPPPKAAAYLPGTSPHLLQGKPTACLFVYGQANE